MAFLGPIRKQCCKANSTLKSGKTGEYRESQTKLAYLKDKPQQPQTSRNTGGDFDELLGTECGPAREWETQVLGEGGGTIWEDLPSRPPQGSLDKEPRKISS